MITYVTHLRVAPENAAEFEAVIGEMTAKVREHEPGVAYYGFGRSQDEPDTYVIIEVYRDEAAFKAHWETDFIRPSLARTKPLVEDGRFDIRRYVCP